MRTVEAGSFTAAAAQLGVAKSAVSRRVVELEQRLDVQLIVRSTRRLSLTEAGQTLYDRAVRLLVDWEEAEASVSTEQTSLKGSIRLTLPLSFGHSHIGYSVLAFQQRYPEVAIDIELTDRKVDLIAEGFDLAVRIGELSDSSMVARKLDVIDTTVVASPQYLAAHGTPNTPEQLSTHRELRFALRGRKGWSYTAPDGSRGEFEMMSGLRANSGDFLRDAAIGHHGVAILPRFIVQPALDTGELIELLPDYQWPALNAYALYPSSKHLPRRVRALVEYLMEHCHRARAS